MELLYKDEVYAIVGAAIEVHRHLKSGFLEAIYQEAMEMELAGRGIPAVPQAELQVFYKGVALKKKYFADFISCGKILVEIKVMEQLTSKEEAQLLNYLNCTGMKVGVLINFGDHGRLDWKRFVL
jgi:GxxExxY protein